MKDQFTMLQPALDHLEKLSAPYLFDRVLWEQRFRADPMRAGFILGYLEREGQGQLSKAPPWQVIENLWHDPDLFSK